MHTAQGVFEVKIWRGIALQGIILYTGDNLWWKTQLNVIWVIIEVLLKMSDDKLRICSIARVRRIYIGQILAHKITCG
jgi:hypothetical protein